VVFYGVDRKVITSPDDVPSGSWGYPVLKAYSWNHPDSGDMVVLSLSHFLIDEIAKGEDVLGGGARPDPTKFFETVAVTSDGAKPESAGDFFG
jgi:hypothetical protein